MKANQAMSAGNTRLLVLFLVVMTVLALGPVLSHASVFWDDEMEEGASEFSTAYMASTLIPQGTMAYDINVKFSGRGSIRLNYPAACKTTTTQNQCGGSATRKFPLTDTVWKRVYFRMSGTGPNPTSSGVFETAPTAFTKMLKGQSLVVNNITARYWWDMGCCGSKSFEQSQENVPSPGHTTSLHANFTFTDNIWYCIETHEQMNTPGAANGISEAWIDGRKVAGVYNVMWQQAESALQWSEFSIFRQIGAGNIWWDRFAAGDTRIGCLGATTASDTTRPGPPHGLTAR